MPAARASACHRGVCPGGGSWGGRALPLLYPGALAQTTAVTALLHALRQAPVDEFTIERLGGFLASRREVLPGAGRGTDIQLRLRGAASPARPPVRVNERPNSALPNA